MVRGAGYLLFCRLNDIIDNLNPHVMKIKAFLIAILITGMASAQNFRSVESIGIDEISVIEIAGNGDAWIGSKDSGIAFYKQSINQWAYYKQNDGVSNLPSNTITSIALGPISTISNAFIGTNNGGVIDQSGAWAGLDSTASKNVLGIVFRPDSIWAFVPAGCIRIDSSKHYQSIHPHPRRHISCVQTQGNCPGFWVGTTDSGAFFSVDGQGFSFVNHASRNLVNDSVNCIATDNMCGAVLIGTKGGFSRCPVGPSPPPCQNFTTANGLPENDVTTITDDCRGNVWVGTRNNGLAIYNNSTFTTLTTANGLSSNQITAIGFTANCEAWVGSKDGGISVVDTNHTVVKVLTTLQEIKDEISYSVRVYPQPASNALNFTFGTHINSGELRLVDVQGRMIKAFNISNNGTLTADVSSLTTGMYFYQILNEGKMITSGKVQVLK